MSNQEQAERLAWAKGQMQAERQEGALGGAGSSGREVSGGAVTR